VLLFLHKHTYVSVLFPVLQVLKTLNHPNIIHLEDTYETADRIYMVMEMMMGGELFDYVVEKGTLSEEEASVIVRKVTSAVAHMHGLDIIHRDLKPENLVRAVILFSNEMSTFFLYVTAPGSTNPFPLH
jgi:serine/threonine protein kinase